MRAFIAVCLPEELGVCVWETVRGDPRRSSNAPEVDGVRWVRPENLHFTLKFLGELSDHRVPDVVEAMEAAAAGTESFLLKLVGVGGFPKLEKPRVIWVGTEPQGARGLSALAARLEMNLEPLGFERERRPMRPHLTIARLRKPERARGLEPWSDALESFSFGAFNVAEIVLFQSILSRSSAVYHRLHTVPLLP